MLKKIWHVEYPLLVFAIPVLPKTGLPIFGAIFDIRKPLQVETGNFE